MLGTHPIIRYINENRKKIINVILAIIVFFVILRTLNYMAENKIAEEQEQENKYQAELKLKEEHQELIKDFLDFCINGDESSAYAMLSSQSKKIDYKTLEDFNENYINKYFSSKKIYNITFMNNENEEYSYSVKILNDILSTGKMDNNAINQIFIISNENDEYKILINN